MNFSKVRLSDPKGLDLVWRNSSQSVFQLDSAQGWELESSELGVIATHASRREALLLPWAQVAHCDVLNAAESTLATLGDVARKGRKVG
jgi:hypothetical protein